MASEGKAKTISRGHGPPSLGKAGREEEGWMPRHTLSGSKSQTFNRWKAVAWNSLPTKQ